MTKLIDKAQRQASSDINVAQNITPLRKPVKCPNCKKPSSRKSYPFCSKHCADVDLGRWFDESYALE